MNILERFFTLDTLVKEFSKKVEGFKRYEQKTIEPRQFRKIWLRTT